MRLFRVIFKHCVKYFPWKLDFVKSKFCSARLLLVYDQRRKSLKERRPWRPIVAISPFLWVGKGSFLREFGLANATEELSRRGMIKTDLPCTTDAVTQLHLFHVLCCRIRTRNQEENRAFFFSITRKGHRSIRKTQPDYTMFENHKKSLIQYYERSELRLHFERTKVD